MYALEVCSILKCTLNKTIDPLHLLPHPTYHSRKTTVSCLKSKDDTSSPRIFRRKKLRSLSPKIQAVVSSTTIPPNPTPHSPLASRHRDQSQTPCTSESKRTLSLNFVEFCCILSKATLYYIYHMAFICDAVAVAVAAKIPGEGAWQDLPDREGYELGTRMVVCTP